MHVDIKEWGASRNSLTTFCLLNRLSASSHFLGYSCISPDSIDNAMVHVGIDMANLRVSSAMAVTVRQTLPVHVDRTFSKGVTFVHRGAGWCRVKIFCQKYAFLYE